MKLWCQFQSFDREIRRLMKQEEAMGTLGLSMYDRVKQRSSARPDDAAKKHRALELLQERTKNRRGSVQVSDFFCGGVVTMQRVSNRDTATL